MSTDPTPGPVRALAAAVRRRWRMRATARGVLRALTWLGVGVAALLLLDLALGLPVPARAVLRWVPGLLVLGALAAATHTARRLNADRTTTLWLEEQGADPDHLLTTALEADLSTFLGRAVRARAERRAGQIAPARVLPWDMGRPGGWALLAVLIAAVVLTVFPGGPPGAGSRWLALSGSELPGSAPEVEAADATGASEAPPRIAGVDLTLTPPAYTGLPARSVSSSEVVRTLAGTRVALRVDATAGEVAAERIGVGALRLRRDVSTWSGSWRVTPSDRGLDLSLSAGDAQTGDAPSEVVDRRVVPLAVVEDRPPEVHLARPETDLVVATASGQVEVRARVVDDYGTGDWALHWVRSSGSGESFSFEEGEWAWDSVVQRGDTLVGTLRLDLASTGMGPGDVLHVRAEALDQNDVTGPGLGVSATRQIRVVTDDAMDEVTTLIGFPIERDREPLLSQRMIILMTERLLASADTLSEGQYAVEANAIADEQDRLRERIEEAIFVREDAPPDDHDHDHDIPGIPEPAEAGPVQVLELPGHSHDGSPILDVNPDLLVAFNAMWDAGRLLRQTEVPASLPPQHVALDHLQKLREADRVYARGRVERPPVDLDAARGTGELDGARPAPRSSSPAGPDPAHWRGEIERAAAALGVTESAEMVLRLRELTAALLEAAEGTTQAAGRLAAAAERLEDGVPSDARRLLAEAAHALTPAADAGRAPPPSTPADATAARYQEQLTQAQAPDVASTLTRLAGQVRPFVFATARYRSGDWDSAPLVPSNLIHSLAQYTSLPVQEEGVIVDLSSPELFRYPFVFLTGHLPLRLDDGESAGLRRYVQRGGFLFIDDHNHDIDGAFHRSVLSELARIFGPDALKPLPNDHELYRSFFAFEDGPPITGHELSGWGDGLIHEELFAIEVDGRIGVLYSNKDYASEWSYHAENKRFLALDNTRFGVNVLLYALTR